MLPVITFVWTVCNNNTFRLPSFEDLSLFLSFSIMAFAVLILCCFFSLFFPFMLSSASENRCQP
ncbi:uncharacterized protein BDW47DRAFT_87187 [Aspergillus candidus]|uniref:Uncharacterized protein n=1 Tax=Aspergillus candidus TaxID=41067 RepID=A0A2I2EZH3_ASPCN|nr:hypothetical protein BDW47DRAFT_87187 [Aspergillus candidus]PLB33774.1 hypothetical protein BDW47DRAFT_87187 [Aspergillus candidus]